MTLSSDLLFDSHIDSMCAKALWNLGFIIRRICGTMDSERLKILYFALVRSGVEFGSVVGKPTKVGLIEKIDPKTIFT